MGKRIHLYFDDSGSRRPDHKQHPQRQDGMDHFALGGILINEGTDTDTLIQSHNEFTRRWNIAYPLHSSKIRGCRESFSWLRHNDHQDKFLQDLERFLLSLPALGIACVIDRPGYVARYAEKYAGQPWLMCKTAFAILIERSAKHAQRHAAQLEVFFEQSGRAEDHDIKTYMRNLKNTGMPFDSNTSQGYGALTPTDFCALILGEPRERTKKTAMIQIADMFLYPMVKAGYDRNYSPYRKLLEAGKIIDAHLTSADLPHLGVKYSCFT